MKLVEQCWVINKIVTRAPRMPIVRKLWAMIPQQRLLFILGSSYVMIGLHVSNIMRHKGINRVVTITDREGSHGHVCQPMV